MLNRLFFYFLAFAFLFVGMLLLAPVFIDTEGYKKDVAEVFKAMTGVEAVIEGDIEISFFPRPFVRVSRVKLPSEAGALAPNIFTVQAIEIRPSLKAMILGGVDFKEIYFDKPIVAYEKFVDGKDNWSSLFEFGKDGGGEAKLPRVIHIMRGRFVYYGGGDELIVDNVSAKLLLSSRDGPFDISGNFDSYASVVSFSLNVGSLSENDAPVVAKLFAESFNIDLSGSLAGESDKEFSGEIVGNIDKLSVFVKNVLGESAILARIFSEEELKIKGGMTLSSNKLILKDLTFNSPSIESVVKVKANFGKRVLWDVSCNVSKLDVDALTKLPPVEEGEEDMSWVYLEEGISADDITFDIARDFSGLFLIEFEEIIYKKDKIRNVHLDMDVFNGDAIIHDFSALLPGDSRLHFSGGIKHNDVRPLLNGAAELSGSSLRKVVVWLRSDWSFFPKDSLGVYLFKSDLVMTPSKISLTDISGSVDKLLLVGSAEISPSARHLTVVKSNIKIDRLDLDRYLLTDQIYKGIAAFSKDAAEFDFESSWLQTLQMSFSTSLELNEVVFNGEVLDRVFIDFALVPGVLSLQRFVVSSDLLRSRFSFKANFTDRPFKFDFKLKAPKFDTSLLLRDNEGEEEKEEARFLALDKFNLMGAGRFVGEVSIDIASLRHGRLILKDVLVEGDVAKSVFKTKNAEATFYGGSILLNGSVGLNESSPSIGVSMIAKNIPLEYVNQLYSDNIKVKGKANVAARFSAFGKNPRAWLNGFNSLVKVNATNVVVNGFDLDRIAKEGPVLISALDVSKLLDKLMSSGNTLFKLIKLEATTKGGVLSVKNAALYSELTQGSVSLNTNLENLKTKMVSRFSFRPSNKTRIVSLKMMFDGALDKFKLKVDYSDLENFITEKSAR